MKISRTYLAYLIIANALIQSDKGFTLNYFQPYNSLLKPFTENTIPTAKLFELVVI